MVDFSDVLARIRRDWPATLAVLVLATTHVALSIAGGDQARPLGIPLFAAVAVFVIAELGRTLWRTRS